MIYFILPIYNEEDNLAPLIQGIRQRLRGEAYKIVAVNDGSSDRSLEILESLQGGELCITGSLVNMNVGAVFSAGISRVLAEAHDDDVMFIMESDQTSEQELIMPMAQKIRSQEADVVVASRYQAGGGYRNFPLPRLVFSRGANWMMRRLFPVGNIFDYTIFFRAYRAGIIRRAVEHFGPFGLIQSRGFVANAELLVKLSLFTSKIIEIPFAYNYGRKKGASKIHVFRTISEYFVLASYLKSLLGRYEAFRARQEGRGV